MLQLLDRRGVSREIQRDVNNFINKYLLDKIDPVAVSQGNILLKELILRLYL